MARFSYLGIDIQGKNSSGEIVADDAKDCSRTVNGSILISKDGDSRCCCFEFFVVVVGGI